MLSCSVALYLYTYQVGTKTWFTLVSLVLDCTSLCLAGYPCPACHNNKQWQYTYIYRVYGLSVLGWVPLIIKGM